MILPAIKLSSAVDEALVESGFKDPTAAKGDAQNSAREILNKTGADLKIILSEMVQIMRVSENDSVRLKAVENALTIHGVDLKHTDGQSAQAIHFHFDGLSNGDVKIQNVLCPADRG